MYGKQAGYAIAAMIGLTQAYYNGNSRLSASEIATSRNLPSPTVAKVLSILSQAGLIKGAPGPGGGFVLNHDPDDITLNDVVILFERMGDLHRCPFDSGICSDENPCPLHEKMVAIQHSMKQLLTETTFATFRDKMRPPASGSH